MQQNADSEVATKMEERKSQEFGAWADRKGAANTGPSQSLTDSMSEDSPKHLIQWSSLERNRPLNPPQMH